MSVSEEILYAILAMVLMAVVIIAYFVYSDYKAAEHRRKKIRKWFNNDG